MVNKIQGRPRKPKKEDERLTLTPEEVAKLLGMEVADIDAFVRTYNVPRLQFQSNGREVLLFPRFRLMEWIHNFDTTNSVDQPMMAWSGVKTICTHSNKERVRELIESNSELPSIDMEVTDTVQDEEPIMATSDS